MLQHPLRGPDRRSMITGRSVHNQRIERLWRDLWFSVLSNYYTAFRHLEDSGHLDPDNDLHLLCLLFVMIPRINAHLEIFRHAWDRHGLSSEGGRSPDKLWIAGQLSQFPTLCDQVDGSWGVDWDGPVATENIVESTVTVPEPPVALRDIVVSRLSDSIDPFMHSNSFGIEIYKEAVNFASNVLGL
ncbi:hypothetical protein AALO_G00309830 [Alosa alosa]|uniref:Integrase core domain-containing protein n=1 Tax=Alosa alosa TaxID=278164 RepID=A0AAV6FCH7_9TELE|nr:hypothetical protein AALO_G00309830 [Alosa alosa]